MYQYYHFEKLIDFVLTDPTRDFDFAKDKFAPILPALPPKIYVTLSVTVSGKLVFKQLQFLTNFKVF